MWIKKASRLQKVIYVERSNQERPVLFLESLACYRVTPWKRQNTDISSEIHIFSQESYNHKV